MIWSMLEWEQTSMIDSLHIKLMLVAYLLMTLPILSENWSCQSLQKTCFKFILEVVLQVLKQTSLLLLLLLLNSLKLTTLQFKVLAFLVLITVIMDKQLLLCLAVLQMLTLKVFQLSHGQRVIIHNLNTHFLNLNMKIKLKKIDASMVLRRALPQEMLVL